MGLGPQEQEQWLKDRLRKHKRKAKPDSQVQLAASIRISDMETRHYDPAMYQSEDESVVKTASYVESSKGYVPSQEISAG